MDKTAKMSCSQIDLFKRERLFELYNDKYLRVVNKDNKGTTEYTIALISLLPDSSRILRIAWDWLALAIVFLLIGGGAVYYLVWDFSLESTIYLILICLVSLLLAAGAVYFLLLKTEHNQVFYTRYGNYPLIELMFGKPDKKYFNEFINQLHNKINAEMESNTISAKNLQAGEMKMLRRLTTLGVLSQDDYDQAKNKIFSYIDSQDVE